jgi:hypothetical protein
MSVIHKIINKRPLSTQSLETFVSTIDGAMCRDKNEETSFFWIDGKSTRGVDITIEPNFIEVRNTVLSNRFDYELTNKIVDEILVMTNGIVLNEEDEIVNDFPIFDNHKIAENEIHDCEVINHFVSKGQQITVFSPIRDVHLGEHTKFESHEGEQLKNEMFDLILKVNYQLPDFGSSGIMQVTDPENPDKPKIMKVVSSGTDYILGKYDYILLFIDENEPPIMITNEILNTMLPSNWTLVDEFTIVAPAINEDEWEKLLTNAKKYDLWESFNSK